MELSKIVIDGILKASDERNISDSVYNCILNDVFETATGKKGYTTILGECDQKIVHSSFLSLLLEAAKHDAHSSTLRALLEECEIGSQRVDKFLNMYHEKKEKIQLQLSLIEKSHNQIVDASWRQDCVVKSNNCEKICQLRCMISLKTWNTETNCQDTLTFGCSMVQLQDLVMKLKDATKCVERNSG